MATTTYVRLREAVTYRGWKVGLISSLCKVHASAEYLSFVLFTHDLLVLARTA